MVWNFLKKTLNKKQKESSEKNITLSEVKTEKPKLQPAVSEKKVLSDEEIDKEIKKMSPELIAHVKDPAARQKIIELSKKMIKDGVDIRNEKQVKNWMKNHPEESKGEETPKVETYRRTEPKIGRNDPCLCGSGKKYKKCCAYK